MKRIRSCACEKKGRRMWQKVLFYGAVFLLLNIIVYPIAPMFDDWYYDTAPNPNFSLSQLLPGEAFWRPLDVLFGAFLGLCPKLFPVLNRAVVIFAHVANAYLLSAIAQKLEIKQSWRRFGVCFFLFSSAIWAVVTSPDALNQAYSAFFGLLGLYLYAKRGGYSYIPLCMVALLWKESGVSWFFVIPVYEVIVNCKTWDAFFKSKERILRAVKQVALGLLMVLVYFVVRFALYGEIALGSSEGGTYKLSLLSFSAVKNLVLLLASASTGVDSMALLGVEKSLLLAGFTLLLSGVFLAACAYGLIRMVKGKNSFFGLLLLVICVLGLALPLVLLGNAGEMHAYPVLCGMMLVFCFVLDRSGLTVKQLCIPVVCLFLAFGISSAHKLMSIYEYSDRTKELTESLYEQYEQCDEPTLYVVVNDWKGYSVFTQSSAMGTSYGLSLRPYYDWAVLERAAYFAESEEDASAYIRANAEKYGQIIIIRDETAEKVK